MVDNWERLAAAVCLPVGTPAEEISNLRGTSDDTTWLAAKVAGPRGQSPPAASLPRELDENTQLVEIASSESRRSFGKNAVRRAAQMQSEYARRANVLSRARD